MKLYLNRDIAPDKAKMGYWMSGDDCVSYTDISGFLDYMAQYAPEDNRIDVEIHSCGGDCTEGYAIYDALRASGKEIHCCVVGDCASMASIILLAAPLENRTMYEHAQMLIHEPYYPEATTDLTLPKLDALKESLESEKAKMMAVYVERTGQPEEIISAQMSAGTWFGADKAIELGFIGLVVPAMSAMAGRESISTTTSNINKQMKIDETSAIGKALAVIAKACGAIEKESAVSMVVTDVTGTEINIEREEGEPQVGDKTDAADGEYTLEDGRVLVVEGGEITEIKDAEEETTEEETTTEEVTALKAEIENLKQQLADAQSNAKSEEDNKVLAYVAKAGGLDSLKKKAVGSFVPQQRNNKSEEISNAQASLREQIDALKTKRASK